MLAVITRVRPSRAMGSFIFCIRRCERMCASWSWVRSASTQNSSPAKRATTSLSRNTLRMRSETIFSSSSPESWPRESLIRLK